MSQHQTPKKMATRSVNKSQASVGTSSVKTEAMIKRERTETPRSNSRSVKLSKRRFFNVQEDLQILEHFKRYEHTQSANQMAQILSTKIHHSEESIRDRIRRVLSKLRQVDSRLLSDEARVVLAY